MKTRYDRIALVLLSAALPFTAVTPAAADVASGAATAGTVAAEKTNPTYDAALARRVLVAQGVLKQSQTTTTGLKKKVSRQEFAKMLVQLSPYKDKVGTTVQTSMYSDVKRTSAYAPYIRIVVENGWMKGNLSGKFRPKQAVTLQESVAAVLAVLGYEDSDFKGSLASAKMSFYKAQKLDTNIRKTAE